LFNISCSQTNGLVMHEMGQINEFMKKFTSKLEVIWGITFDESLEDQLKVTLLATGFNIHSVTQVGERMQKKSDEEIRKEQEASLKREKWKETLYSGSLPKATRYKKYEPYVLTDEQMDDDAVIDLLIQEPANKRDGNFLVRVNY
jgi:cell division protein FtsZ